MPPKGRFRSVAGAGILAFWAAIAGPAAGFETVLKAPAELRDRLAGASAVMSAKARGLTGAQELVAASLSDYRTLVQVLYDRGYFGPVVHVRLDGREAADIDPLDPPSRVERIVISVDPGRPFRFGRAAMAPQAPATRLPAGFAPGRPASSGVLQDAARAGVLGWREAGHAKAGVGGQRIVANHARAELDADIALNPGPLLRFGAMTIAGDSDVRPDAIRRIAGFPTGEVYSPAQMKKVGTRLRRTGAFAALSLIEAERANPDDTLDVTASFEDMPKRRIEFGGAISSNTGVELSAVWSHRNLFGGAERLQLEGRLRNIGGPDAIDGMFALRLERPDRLGPDDSLFYTARFERKNRTHYDATLGSAGIGVRRVFSDALTGDIAVVAAYTRADDAYGSNREFHNLTLPTRLEWDRRDSKVNATSGVYLNGALVPFAGFRGADSGARITVDGRAFWSPVRSGRMVLAGRVQAGSVVGAALRATSPELLFLSGGAGTVRGQPFESLGVPVGAATAGGRSFLGVSAELRGQVSDKISLVGFYDLGLIDAASFIGGSSSSHSGAGIGLRYDLGGLGPLRLDVARPAGGATGSGTQFYLGIGQAF